MSELWRELISRDSPELSGCLSLSRVSISKRTGRIGVVLDSTKLLTRADRKRLEGCMQSAFPQVKLDLSLRYPTLRDEVAADIGRASPLLKELLSHERPGAVHFLDWKAGAWRL